MLNEAAPEAVRSVYLDGFVQHSTVTDGRDGRGRDGFGHRKYKSARCGDWGRFDGERVGRQLQLKNGRHREIKTRGERERESVRKRDLDLQV
jgi:hypothetical protein